MNRYALYLLAVFLLTFSRIGNAQVITKFAGTGSSGYCCPGYPATMAQLDLPVSVVTDTAGNVFIADNTHAIRKVNAAGYLDWYAGTGCAGGSGDGGPATSACVGAASVLATDLAGNLYFADGDVFKIRKINATTGIITSIAGTGACGYSGDGGPAASAAICLTPGLTVKGSSVLLSQFAYNLVRQISGGTMYAYAGYYSTGGYSGDGGPALSATFRFPGGMAVGPTGNVYIVDIENKVVRMVNPAGNIYTIAGNTDYGTYGDGGPATAAAFMEPRCVAVDTAGNIYVSDRAANVVRKIDPAGIISTYVGTGDVGYYGDGGPAVLAKLHSPMGIAVDRPGNLYIADEDNNMVRKVSVSGNSIPTFAGGNTQSLGACVSAAGVSLGPVMKVNDGDIGQTDRWVVTSAPTHGTLGGFPYAAVTTGSAIVPTGLTYAPTPGYTGPDSFVVRVSDSISVSYTKVYVTVDFYPDAGIVTGPSTVCTAGATTLSSTVSGGTWTATNATASVAGGVVYGATVGTDTIIYTVTNACGFDTARKAISVIAGPATGTITGPTTVCVGAVISLADVVSGGTWSAVNTNASVSGSGVVTGVHVGVDTIRYSVSSLTCVSWASHIVTVNTVPSVPPINGPTYVCTGSPITLSDTSSVAGTWSASNARATVSAGGVVTGVSSGVDTIIYTVSNSCGNGYAYYPVTVIFHPASVAAIDGPDDMCVDDFVIMTDATPGGSWVSSNSFVASVDALGGVTALSAGTTVISYTFSSVCGTRTATHALAVGCDVSVPGMAGKEGMGLYPNPTTGHFTLTLPGSVSPGVVCRITDPVGRVVSVTTVIESPQDISLHVAPGVYFVSVLSGGVVYNTRLVVY